jgi:hypothetical protein
MSKPCRARRRVSLPGAGERQLGLVVRVDDDPMVEVAAARLLLVVLDELRTDGLVVRQVRVEMDG